MKTTHHLTVAGLGLALFIVSTAMVEAEDYTYETNDNTITITAYIGSGGDLTIPDRINGLPVTRIGDSAFFWGRFCVLGTLTIPNSVTSIGDSAFSECYLTNLVMGNSVTSIGDEAFSGCSLASIAIPNSVTNIGNGAFKWCNNMSAITVDAGNLNYSSVDGVLFNKAQRTLIRCPGGRVGTYSIPNAVTSIEYEAFDYCLNLTNVTIGNSVTNIDNGAFNSCFSLLAFTVDAGNLHYTSLDGVLFHRNQTALIRWPNGRAGSYAIPNTVTSIGDWAFSGCYLTNIVMGNSIATIGNSAFSGIGCLTSVAIPNTVTRIGDRAFSCCTSLSTEIPGSVTSIGEEAFSQCGLTSVRISNSVTNIGDRAFSVCSHLTAITVDAGNLNYSSVDGVLFNKSQTTLLQYPGGRAGSYVIPNTVTSIGYEAFYFCDRLTNVTISDSVTRIGVSSFNCCGNLAAFTVGADNLNYSSVDGVLFNKSQTTLIRYPGGRAGSYAIPNTVISIGDEAFYNCFGLTDITIPNSVTSIGVSAFAHCYWGLSSIMIPNSITRIGDRAFFGSSLATIYFQGNAPTVGAEVFFFTPQLTAYYLPGAIRWGTTLGARPTAPWILPYPVILTTAPDFGIQTNGFGFRISWATNASVVVEACSSSAGPSWTAVGTNTLTDGWSDFSDSDWMNHPARFYRVKQQ